MEALAGRIGERHVWRPAALQASAQYIEDELSALGYAVAEQPFSARGVPCCNLEAAVPGHGPADESIVVGAHYDTVVGSPGADDNASGIAGLIEIARLLADSRPVRTVKLVAFANEEAPFFGSSEMGSRVYADVARGRRENVRVMLSLEMLGFYSSARGSQAYPALLKWFYPERGDFIAFVSNLRSAHALGSTVRAFRQSCDFPAERLASPAFVPGVAWSDQSSFWNAGYPAVMVTDTAFYRYPHYHQPSDTPDKLHYPEMARVVKGLARTVAALASP